MFAAFAANGFPWPSYPHSVDMLYAMLLMLASITVLGNVIFATLITIRVYSLQRRISKIFGKAYSSLYIRIISICVESCALTTVVYFIFLLFTYFRLLPGHWTIIPQALVVHASVSLYSCGNQAETWNFQVVSPILVIKRVAQGNDATTMVVESLNTPMSSGEPEQTRSGHLQTTRFRTSAGSPLHDHDGPDAGSPNMSQVVQNTTQIQ